MYIYMYMHVCMYVIMYVFMYLYVCIADCLQFPWYYHDFSEKQNYTAIVQNETRGPQDHFFRENLIVGGQTGIFGTK